MTFEDIVNANKTFNLTDISGKDYVKVNQRVKGFRKLMPEGTIETEILKWENGSIVIKATVKDGTGKILATGMDCEKEGSSYINKFSYVENCETSAVGRALGFLGLGIDTEMASADEMEIALEKERQDKEKNSSAKPEAPKDEISEAKIAERTAPLKYVPKSGKSKAVVNQCENCKQVIQPKVCTDGHVMSAAEIIALSMDRAGKTLCPECLRAELAKLKQEEEGTK